MYDARVEPPSDVSQDYQRLINERMSQLRDLEKVREIHSLLKIAKESNTAGKHLQQEADEAYVQMLTLQYVARVMLVEASTLFREIHELLGVQEHPGYKEEVRSIRGEHEQIQRIGETLRERGCDLEELRKKHLG